GVDRWTQLTYTLLGDPETPLWCAPQLPLTVSFPASIVLGAQNATATVTDASGPVAGALVCAAKPNEGYAVGRTDALGHVQLEIEPRSTGTLTLTVTAPDHLPNIGTRTIATPIRALVLADLGLADDGGTSGIGNDDGRIDAGETVRLSLP